MSNQLQEILDSIIEEKNTKLRPENLREGIKCLGVDGELKEAPDMSDATVTAADIAAGKIAYGNEGKITGTLGDTLDSTFNESNSIVQLYGAQQAYYDSLSPKVVSDSNLLGGLSRYTLRYIPCKSDGTPLLDTSNVTNMEDMFTNMSDLLFIPKINTSNVTNMDSMFRGTDLKIIPLLDTSKVTNMDSMFMYSKLETFPQLDMSKVTTATWMFRGASVLKNVPILNFSSLTNAGGMFNSCPMLTEDSLNNILASLATASITDSLTNIGFSSSQITTMQTLSNYQTLIDKGWTA